MRRYLSCVLILVCSASTAAAADKWWDFYKRGTLAAQTKDWSTVRSEMQKSVALMPQEQLAAKARNEILVYVPHFWLGLAKFHLGDVEGALDEWQISQSQGVVQKTQYYADLRAWLSRAQAQQAKSVHAQSSESRNAANAALSKALNGQVEAMGAGADKSDSFRTAKRKLDEAWQQFNKAGNDPKAYQVAQATAAECYDLFQAAAREAQAKKIAAKQAPQRVTPPVSRPAPASSPQTAITQPPPQQKPAATPPIQQPKVEVAQVTAPPPAVKTPEKTETRIDVVATKEAEPNIESEALVNARISLQQLKRRLVDSKALARGDKIFDAFITSNTQYVAAWEKTLRGELGEKEAAQISDSITRMDREVNDRITSFRPPQAVAMPERSDPSSDDKPVKNAPTKEAVRKQLRTAYVTLAKGDFNSSEHALTSLINLQARSEQAYLLRGCARYTRSMLAKEPQALSGAEADFIAALTLNPSVGLDPKFFSPKLISFFRDVQRKQAGMR